MAKRRGWNWPIGILNIIAFTILFLGAGLYGETVLRAAFAAAGVYSWVRGAKNTSVRNDLLISNASRNQALGAVAVTTAGVALILTHGTGSQVPWPHAFVLAASLLATYGQAKKYFQLWYVNTPAQSLELQP